MRQHCVPELWSHRHSRGHLLSIIRMRVIGQDDCSILRGWVNSAYWSFFTAFTVKENIEFQRISLTLTVAFPSLLLLKKFLIVNVRSQDTGSAYITEKGTGGRGILALSCCLDLWEQQEIRAGAIFSVSSCLQTWHLGWISISQPHPNVDTFPTPNM